MHHQHRHASRRAFTLIELLVVIAIIAILIALLVPSIKKARNAAKRTKAKHDIMQLVTAFNAYYQEYAKWPTGLVGYDTAAAETTATGIQVAREVVRMLGGEDINGQNPKLLPFLDIAATATNRNGKFIDPWDKGDPANENAYKYMLDFDGDNKVHIEFSNNSSTTNLNAVVAVWSRGLDQSDEGRDANGDGKIDWDDDVRSW